MHGKGVVPKQDATWNDTSVVILRHRLQVRQFWGRQAHKVRLSHPPLIGWGWRIRLGTADKCIRSYPKVDAAAVLKRHIW
jgi:hypothetical protein